MSGSHYLPEDTLLREPGKISRRNKTYLDTFSFKVLMSGVQVL